MTTDAAVPDGTISGGGEVRVDDRSLSGEVRVGRWSRLAHAAVHAALSGRTEMMVGRWHGRFVHVPMSLVTGTRSVVDPEGDLWLAVLEATGQPPAFTSLCASRTIRAFCWGICMESMASP